MPIFIRLTVHISPGGSPKPASFENSKNYNLHPLDNAMPVIKASIGNDDSNRIILQN